MIHPVCVKDKVSYRPHKNSVFVFEMARTIPAPHIYKIWAADTKICPVCKHVVVVGFAERALSEHYKDGFQELVDKIRVKETVVECYEHLEDVPNE